MIRVASWPHWYAPNRYQSLLYAALEAHGVEHVRDAALAWKAIDRVRPTIDVVHLHWAEWAWQQRRTALGQRLGAHRLARFLADPRARRTPLVWTVHNLVLHASASARADRAGFEALHRHVALRVFHSEWARRLAVELFPAAAHVPTMVMPHGNYDGVYPLPRPRDVVLRELGIDPDCRVLVCVGNLRPYKGADVAIAAMRRLDMKRHHLIVAGRANPEMQQRLGARGLVGVTLATGLLSEQRLADVVGAADGVLLPYREVTGSGALLTALTLGRGVVVSDLPYFHEVLDAQPASSEYATAGDPDALAAAIRRYFTIDAATRGRAARALADRFAWSDVVRPFARWLQSHGATAGRGAAT